MSDFKWTNGRTTKRPEDKAYSLLGVFDVRMRLDYGEGEKSAFARLRKKIEKRETTYAHSNDPPTRRLPKLLEFRMIGVQVRPELKKVSAIEMDLDYGSTMSAIEIDLDHASTRGITSCSDGAPNAEIWCMTKAGTSISINPDMLRMAETKLGTAGTTEHRLVYWQLRLLAEVKRSRWRSRGTTRSVDHEFVFARDGPLDARYECKGKTVLPELNVEDHEHYPLGVIDAHQPKQLGTEFQEVKTGD